MCGLLGSACVDEFKGANIQVDFGPAVPAQVRQGVAPIMGFQLPAPTHFRLYGIRETRDNNGTVLSSTYTELQRFEIHRIVERFNPCFLEPDAARYPGLHASQNEARIKEDTGITNIEAPPAGATEDQLIDVATAMQRSLNITELSREPGTLKSPSEPQIYIFGGLKAVTSASPANYPAAGMLCGDNAGVDRSLIPPTTCTDDESNKIRLDVCTKFWANNPGFYEGTDRVLTDPLSGTYFGIVTGPNPINNAILGGTQFFVDDPMIDYDAFAVHVVPDGSPDGEMAGTMLVQGRPASTTRGVIRGQLLPPVLNTQTANLVTPFAIFSDLGGDNVHF